MIVSRTPLRLSLLGGGTDYPAWYRENGGLVIGGTINKFSYITARYLPPFHPYRSKFVYSTLEQCHHNSSVSHKAIKATLKYLGLADPDSPGLEVFHSGDLPGRSGTGSSSTFVVGLLNALATLQGRLMVPYQLADAAIEIEQKRLGECVGCQDQTWAAYGGLNHITFKGEDISVNPLTISNAQIEDLEQHLLLFFTGITRTSSEIAQSYAPRMSEKEVENWAMIRLTEQGLAAIHRGDWRELGNMVDQTWRIKSQLSNLVTTPEINHLYATARAYGAWGGKITGSGGGGCLVLVAPPEKHVSIVQQMTTMNCIQIPFRFCHSGSTIIYCDRN